MTKKVEFIIAGIVLLGAIAFSLLPLLKEKDDVVLFGALGVTFVQGQSKSSGVSPAAFTALTSVSVGDLIVVTAGGDGGITGAVTGVTDSLGNTYTQVPGFDFANAGGTLNMDVWYTVATVGGASDVVSVAFQDANENFAGVVQQFTGFTGTATYDIKQTSSNASGTTCTSGASASTNQADELVVGMCIHASTASAFSLGAGYTNLTQISVSARQTAMESKIVSSTGSQTATMTIAAARVNMGGLVTFYDSGGGGGGGGATPTGAGVCIDDVCN